MERLLTRWLSTQRTRLARGLTIFSAFFVILLVILAVLSVKLVSIWVTDWQGAHGHYPTGHLTYTVPEHWNVTTLTNLNPAGTDFVWWEAFDDQVTAISPSFSACNSEDACAQNLPTGARGALESAAGHSLPTIEAWYQAWEEATTRSLGPGVVLPLAD